MQPSDTTELRERDGPPAAVALANLAALDRARLRQLWQALWGRPAPAKASCSLLRDGLAWRIQERAYVLGKNVAVLLAIAQRLYSISNLIENR